MEVFRIVHSKWANSLTASGYAARWNSNGLYLIYAAENCSLACLEQNLHQGIVNQHLVLLIQHV